MTPRYQHCLIVRLLESRYDFLAMAIAESVRSKVAKAGPGTLFTHGDFAGPRSAIDTALSRLAGRGVLLRIRKGLYFKGADSRFGPGRPSTEDVVYKICGTTGVGPTGWTASRALGLSTQLPAREEFVVVGTPPTNVSGATFHSRKNLARLDLNPLEIAVIEVLRSWPAFIEASWDDVVARVEELGHKGDVRIDRLMKVAAGEPSPAFRERVLKLQSELAGPFSGDATTERTASGSSSMR